MDEFHLTSQPHLLSNRKDTAVFPQARDIKHDVILFFIFIFEACIYIFQSSAGG